MSPHILIDQALESLEHPDSHPSNSAVVQRLITKMMTDDLITIEEFNHYSRRLLRFCQQRKEAA